MSELVRYHINEWAFAWVRALAYPMLALTMLEARAVEMEVDMEEIRGEHVGRWLSRDLTNDLHECVCCHKRFKKGDEVVVENVIAIITSGEPDILGPTVPYHRRCAGMWPQILASLMEAPDQDTFTKLASRLLGQSTAYTDDDAT